MINREWLQDEIKRLAGTEKVLKSQISDLEYTLSELKSIRQDTTFQIRDFENELNNFES